MSARGQIKTDTGSKKIPACHDLQKQILERTWGYVLKIVKAPAGPCCASGRRARRPRRLPFSYSGHSSTPSSSLTSQQQPALLVHDPELAKLHRCQDSCVGRPRRACPRSPRTVGQRGLELHELDALGRGFQAGLESLQQLSP